ncbi:MAG: V-type ATPase subunit [Clostridia bacterium]|nr:V-type ATPase subunit [Clostridia bacterium]
MGKRNETEYMYASARIRAAEGKDTAGIRLERMLECRSPEQLLKAVLDFGFLAEERQSPADLTEALDLALEDGAALVRNSVPEPSLYDFILYKYDCNNIKVALKAAVLGLDYSSLYYRCGTFSAERLSERLAEGNTEGLPVHMADAVSEARSAYAVNGEGRSIDFCLDRACYADMAACTEASGVSLFRDYTAMRADVTNILSSVRLAARGTKESSAAILEQAFVPGGTLPLSFFTEDGCAGYGEIAEKLEAGVLKDAAVRILAQGDAARPEKEFDNAVHRLVNRERYVPFGVHVPAVFLLNREAELKNCRIIAAGLEAGLSGAALRERVRVDYV